MSEYICDLPIDGMASFVSGGVTIVVGERLVRCRDCRHRDVTHPAYHTCRVMGGEWEDDDFCSCGELREAQAKGPLEER